MTTHANALLALVGSLDPVGYNSGGGAMLVDQVKDEAYFVEVGVVGGGVAGIKRFTAGVVGSEDAQVTATALYGAAHTLNIVACFHPITGDIFVCLDASNSCPIGRIAGATLLSTEIFGEDSSSTAQSTNGPPARVLASGQLIPLWTADRQFIASAAVNPFHEVAVIEVTGAMSLVYAANVPDERAVLCPGANGSACAFYALGRTSINSGPDPVNLYRFDVTDGGVSRTFIRSIAPADIDATWTTFGLGNGPGYDRSDRGILAFFATADAVATTSYLVKFKADGTILWRLPVLHTTILDLAQCSINGLLVGHCLVSANFAAAIDLKDGSVTEIEFNHGLVTLEAQVFDWQLGSVTGRLDFGGYAESTGPVPTYLGDYLAANGDTIPNHRFARAYFGAFAAGQRSYAEAL